MGCVAGTGTLLGWAGQNERGTPSNITYLQSLENSSGSSVERLEVL